MANVAFTDPGYNYETTGTAWHILKRFHRTVAVGEEVKGRRRLSARVSGHRVITLRRPVWKWH